MASRSDSDFSDHAPHLPDYFDSSGSDNEDEYNTPTAKPAVPPTAINNTNNSEPSTFLASSAASDLSTIPSTSDRSLKDPPQPPSQATSFSTAFPLSNVASPANPLPSTSTRPLNPESDNPSVHTKVSSFSFNVWHRQHSLGPFQFGTQSSPQKQLNLLPAIEGEANAPASVSNPSNNPPATNPTSQSSPTSSTTLVPTQEATQDAPPTQPPPERAAPLLTRIIASRKTNNPNLKSVIRNISEGMYYIPLRRMDPFPCRNPGPSTMNAPLMIASPNPSPQQRLSLSLVKNDCAQMMKRAKNYTDGMSRSPTGVSKQRRFQETNKKRKHRDNNTADDVSASTTNNPTQSVLEALPQLPIVTSFAMRTLLLEDVWFLKEGSAVVLFFHDESLPPKYSKKWLNVSKVTEQQGYMPVVSCQGRQYKQLTGWVHRNRDLKEQLHGPRTYEQVRAAMQEFHQHGLHIKFPILTSQVTFNLCTPPQQCMEALLTWFEVFQFPQSVFLQSDYHPERNWLATFRTLKDTAGDDHSTILHRVVQETPGDRFMLSEMKCVWERCKYNKKLAAGKEDYLHAIDTIREEAANAPPPPFIMPDVVKPFCEYVDKRLLERMDDCFGRFTNIFDKFLSEHETRALANEFERQLPTHFTTLMGLSGYTEKLQKLDSSADTKPGHALMLRLRFALDVFFQFVVRVRKQNNHRLVPFGMIFALAQYACGHPLLAIQIPVWMGLSVSKRTMERRLEKLLDGYENQSKRAIRRCTSLLCVFDNLQAGRQLQFQDGQSSVFTRVTARFLMTMYLSNFPDWVLTFIQRPALTFIEQSIPAPLNMPTFELEPKTTTMYNILNSLVQGSWKSDTNPIGNPFDCSGKRVRYYMQLRYCCRELAMVRRYLSTRRRKGTDQVDYTLQPKPFAQNPTRTAVSNAMIKLRKNRTTNLFTLANNFPVEWFGRGVRILRSQNCCSCPSLFWTKQQKLVPPESFLISWYFTDC